MINLFVRLEVQRRYFTICGFEMLSKCFGMQEPSSLEALTSRKTEINLDRLISNGRGLTVDQFLEAKNELKKNDNLRNQLMQGRESFVVFKETAQRQVANSQMSSVLSTDYQSNQTAQASQNSKFGLFSNFR